MSLSETFWIFPTLVTIEISSSAGKFWDYLNLQGIDQTNYKVRSTEVGRALIHLIEKSYDTANIEYGGIVDLSTSYYLVLSWNKQGWYQLHQFSLTIPDPDKINWYFPAISRASETISRRLNGDDSTGTLFEWYGESGGQLKYYPLAKNAIWASERFQLEPLRENAEYGILEKVATYFPELWMKACRK